MGIQWFPGHMTKALRQMEKELKNIDVVFYLLDARAPLSCFNPKLSQLAKNKKIIYILNKADLVEEKDITRFVNFLKGRGGKAEKENVSKEISGKAKEGFKGRNAEAKGEDEAKEILSGEEKGNGEKEVAGRSESGVKEIEGDVVALDSTQSNSGKILFVSARKLLKDKLENKEAKGINYAIKVMVVGVPNVGKSTLINNLCGFSKTVVGDRPGVTRGKQWVTTKDGFSLLDTPGTLWPSFENERVGRNLAYIGSIKDTLTNDLAFYFLKDVAWKYKSNFEKRYNIAFEKDEDALSVFEKICVSKKCLLKKGELDYDRCGRMIIDDFRKGRLGKIVLD